jgi:RNA polymerase sigma-70 factor (ECF subfamily)
MDPRPSSNHSDFPSAPDSEEQRRVWFSNEILPHEPALRAWLKARFPSVGDSDDIVQSSYERLLRSPRGRRIANTKSYLFTIARNLVLDLFRRPMDSLVAASEAERSSVTDERTDVVDAVCTAQEYEILKEAIDELPERCRMIMVMQKIHGFSNQAIAQQLGLSVNTVNAQLVVGLARCRAYLSARGVFRGKRA